MKWAPGANFAKLRTHEICIRKYLEQATDRMVDWLVGWLVGCIGV